MKILQNISVNAPVEKYFIQFPQTEVEYKLGKVDVSPEGFN